MTKRATGVLQEWVTHLSFMQQSVLLGSIRGPDGVPKYHSSKYIIRWFRRAILISSFLGRAIDNPGEEDGGSFYGPSCAAEDNWEPSMTERLDHYMRDIDAIPHHFHLHLMHAAEIVGYKHPNERIRAWWLFFYRRLAHDMHLWPETETQLDARLGDTRGGWLERADAATVD